MTDFERREFLGTNRFIIQLENIGLNDEPIVGGKAWNLHQVITGTDLNVSGGVVITTEARNYYEQHYEDLSKDLTAMGIGTDPAKRYAVRSSATVEDGGKLSYSGVYESMLDVPYNKIGNAIHTVWDSASSEKAAEYHGGSQQSAEMAVIIQEMVDGESAGTAFTVDPITNDPGKMIVNAVAGTCDQLTSGSVEGSLYQLDKPSGHITGSSELLTAEQVQEIVHAAAKIERLFGVPVDIEWGYKKGKLFILQARPITTIAISQKELERFVEGDNWTRHNKRQHNPFLLSISLLGINQYGLKEFGVDDHWLAIQEDPVWFHMHQSGETETAYKNKVADLIRNKRDQIISYLEKAITLDETAQSMINGESTTLDFPDLVNFYSEYLSLASILPGNIMEINQSQALDDQEIMGLCQNLLSRTTFPTFVMNVVEPSAQQWLKKGGHDLEITDLEMLSVTEVLERDLSQLQTRKRGYCVMKAENGAIEIINVPSTRELLISLGDVLSSHESGKILRELRGVFALSGSARGYAELVESTTAQDRVDFKEGDILVTASANPILLKYMRIASAIVSVDGGPTCHAANIARELGIPTVMGVPLAVTIIKHGDLLEITPDPEDEHNALIKIIKSVEEVDSQ